MFFATLFVLLAQAQLNVVDTVDLNAYQGTWNEIASLPASFQKDCYANTSAQYKLQSNGTVEVINSCEKESGEIKVAEGRARINPDFNTPAKLQVTFVKIFNWVWTFGGDYWIIDLDADYQYVIVGHPKKDFAWILSREKTQNNAFYVKANATLKNQGYDTCKILLSRTSEQMFSERPRLCDIK